ncbi:hypothetical protein SAMN04490179_4272 [Pseudomonas antarctica]|uniref:Uncharacterized protein n=1 Tax=Pseudomonas antarctica TaxID=219572 RepID=A0A1H0BF98_9PSED|nr:hypothetical protein PSAN_46150 [Pseudomonas antarctica]SDN44344.1 hypothetical protein SAMN04490179_4272 [Pseudomonas antarctica]
MQILICLNSCLVNNCDSGNHHTDMKRSLKNNRQFNITRRSVLYFFDFRLAAFGNTFEKIVKKMNRTIATTPWKFIIYELYLALITTLQVTQERKGKTINSSIIMRDLRQLL